MSGPLEHNSTHLAISQGDLSVFVTRPISALLLFSSVAVLFGPRLLRLRAADGASPTRNPS